MAIFGVDKGSRSLKDKDVEHKEIIINSTNFFTRMQTRNLSRNDISHSTNIKQRRKHSSSNHAADKQFCHRFSSMNNEGIKFPKVIRGGQKSGSTGPSNKSLEVDLRMSDMSIGGSAGYPNFEDRERFIQLRARFRQLNDKAAIQAEADWELKGVPPSGSV